MFNVISTTFHLTCMFVETRFCQSDKDDMYAIDGFTLFRNDGQSQGTNRPYGGTAIYSRLECLPDFPCQHNRNGIEITVARLSVLPNVNIIVVYRSQTIPVQQLCLALAEVLHLQSLSAYQIIIGDFNINWCNVTDTCRCTLFDLLITDYGFRQLILQHTTDSRTCIDHVYTNIPDKNIIPYVKECYFSDHKPVCLILEQYESLK